MPPYRRTPRRLTLVRCEDRIVPTIYYEAEVNDSVASANGFTLVPGDILTTAPADWTIVQGGIAASADRDFFRITVPTAAYVFLDVDSRDVGLSASLDAVLDVFDASGFTTLGQSDDGYDFDGFTAPTTPVGSATSPDPSLYLYMTPGEYIVRISSFAGGSTGTYQLRMLADPNVSTTVPVMSSLSGAAITLALDFDGQTGSDEWGAFSVKAFNLTGTTATYDPIERLAIRNIFRTVAEDFAPFAVNVTTVPAPSLANGVGYQVVVTSDSATVLGLGASVRGTAQFGGFAGAGSNIGFVFQPPFGDYVGGLPGQAMAAGLEEGTAASQQIGTALGVKHYGGTNPQPSGIMQFPDLGLGRATWSTGTTWAGEPPTISQDDTAVIASLSNGIVLRPDDHGNSIATATIISGAITTGIIADRTTDLDYFRLPAGTSGLFSGRVRVDPFVGNLDAQMSIYNSAGAVLATGNPTDSFDAAADAYLAPGDSYYIEVRSSGIAGGIGSYTLDFAANPAPGPVQIAVTSVNGGVVQRSKTTEVIVEFNQPVTFPSGSTAAFRIATLGGTTMPFNVDFANSTPAHTIARFRFPNGSGGFTTIADGGYLLTVFSANVLDPQGQHLDGDANGVAGDDFVLPFHRLYGDMNGDRTVSQTDFVFLRNAFGLTTGNAGFSPELDFDDNGSIDQNDFVQFRANFGTVV